MKSFVKFFTLLVSISFFFFLNTFGQSTNNEKIDDALYSLKEYVRNWSCVPYVKGTFKENLEISIKDGKLILKENYSESDQKFLGYPEYGKTIIDLTMIRSITVEDNDKLCAGITIKTKENGIKIMNKYRNSPIEVPHPKEKEIRENYGWIDAGIRLNKTSAFQERTFKVISAIKEIAVYYGNKLL